MTKFSDLGLSPTILKTVEAEGYHTPTPIQAQAIPPLLEGRDVLGCAQTGTGKTAAFSLPILHRLMAQHVAHPNQHHHRDIRALILSPTRELTLQIEESLKTYGRGSHLRSVCIFGGVGQGPQTRALKNGVDVVVATPGRLIDLMDQGYVDLSKVQMFVLDEADRMLDMGFIQPIRRIASALPKERQNLLFSATMPKEIRHLADSMLKNPVKVEVAPVGATADLIEQSIVFVPKARKTRMLVHVLESTGVERALIFTRTKHGADRVARDLNRAGIPAEAIHGNKRQNVRQRSLAAFRSGKTWALVATDVAARGIDVEGVSHVINFDLPNEPESYVHRIGRTARAGATGQAIGFCDTSGDERDFLKQIERLIRKPIPENQQFNAKTLPAPQAGEAAHAEDHDDDRRSRQFQPRERSHRGEQRPFRDGPRPEQRGDRRFGGGRPTGERHSAPAPFHRERTDARRQPSQDGQGERPRVEVRVNRNLEAAETAPRAERPHGHGGGHAQPQRDTARPKGYPRVAPRPGKKKDGPQHAGGEHSRGQSAGGQHGPRGAAPRGDGRHPQRPGQGDRRNFRGGRPGGKPNRGGSGPNR